MSKKRRRRQVGDQPRGKQTRQQRLEMLSMVVSELDRKRNLLHLGFHSYAYYLSSPLWASIRLRVIEEKGNKCFVCRDADCDQFHHMDYSLTVLCGDNIDPIFPVCEDCHGKSHSKHKKTRKSPRKGNWRPGKKVFMKARSG